MVCQSHWQVFVPSVRADSDQRLFFDESQWSTIEAITARIIPTDHDPGAREAAVVRYIDRYLSGIDYVYAAPDGNGFLKLDGLGAQSWTERIGLLREAYVDGIVTFDAVSREMFGEVFRSLPDDAQDRVIERISGAPKPARLAAGRAASAPTILQSVTDHRLPFFELLTLHTRQGFYGDPVYGGNRDRVGWQVIGFPGPASLADTQDCSFSLEHTYVQIQDWAELIPHLRESEA